MYVYTVQLRLQSSYNILSTYACMYRYMWHIHIIKFKKEVGITIKSKETRVTK